MVDIYTTPAMEAPAGKTSNLINPYTLKSTRIGLAAAAMAVVLIFVGIRLWVRRKVKKFNSEDWVLIVAVASFAALEAMLIIVSLYGDGKHLWDVSVAELYSTLYYENIAEMMYCTTMFPIKYVLLHQIKSIFFVHDRRSHFHVIINVLIVANFLLYLSLLLTFVFACTPREKIYHPQIEGHCVETTICQAAASALNLASDVMILAIPMFGIARLQMPLKKKLMAGSVFAIGLFAIIASIVRMYYSLTLFWDEDSTFVFMSVGNWTIIEFMTGFIVAGAPYTPRFVELIFAHKDQVDHSYPTYAVSKKVASNMRSADASWIALREHESVTFDGTNPKRQVQSAAQGLSM